MNRETEIKAQIADVMRRCRLRTLLQSKTGSTNCPSATRLIGMVSTAPHRVSSERAMQQVEMIHGFE